MNVFILNDCKVILQNGELMKLSYVKSFYIFKKKLKREYLA